MSSTSEKVTSRLTTGLDGWNHPVRMAASTPLFIVAGAVGSILFQTELVHYGYTIRFNGAVTVCFVLTALVCGLVLLAALD